MKLIKQIQKSLTPDLLKGRWKQQSNPLQGHCYVACEALYHLLPNKQDYKIMVASYSDEIGKCTHWWLEHRHTMKRLDPTKEQYLPNQPPYQIGRATGFLTKKPSKRSCIVIKRVNLLNGN